MISRLIGPRSSLVAGAAALIVSLWAAPTGSARAAAQDVGTEAQRESGKKLYLKYLSLIHI